MTEVREVTIKKRGTDDKGREWTLFQIVTDDNQKAAGFEVVRPGDWVELETSGKFVNYKKVEPAANLNKPAASKDSWPQKATTQDDGGDLEAARKHIMRAANLYNLCVDAVTNAVAPYIPEVAHTSEQFQASVASLFIEACGRRTSDGVNWWSYVDKMPATPLKK